MLVIAAAAVGCTFTGAGSDAAPRAGSRQETDAVPAVTEPPVIAFADTDASVPIELADELKALPAPVTDFAAECVRDVVHQWNNGEWTAPDLSVEHTDKIIRARVVGLNPIPTGAASEKADIRLYLLEYRLLTDRSEEYADLVIQDGEMAELIDGRPWLTERSNAGQPCLLLMRDPETDTWTRFTVTTTGR